MIPATFDYQVAESAGHAIELLTLGGPDAKLLAGGHPLIPMMKFRLARPSVLVDIARIDGLSYIREDGDHIAIGACTRHQDVHRSALLDAACPIVSYAAGLIADPQVRHKGTIGGSAAHADPASDLPSVLLALEAEFVVQGVGGTSRTIAAADFFKGVFQTAVGPNELLTEIRVPKLSSAQGWSFLKFSRRAQDWAVVGVAAIVERSNGGIARARIALTNMGTTPLRAGATEEALAGAGRKAVPAAAALAASGTSPPSDTNATAGFRQHLARVLVLRAVEEALSR